MNNSVHIWRATPLTGYRVVPENGDRASKKVPFFLASFSTTRLN